MPRAQAMERPSVLSASAQLQLPRVHIRKEQALGERDGRDAEVERQAPVQRLLGLVRDHGGALVEESKARPLVEHPGEAHALLLPAGEHILPAAMVHPALSLARTQVGYACGLQSALHCRLRPLGLAGGPWPVARRIADLVPQRARWQVDPLRRRHEDPEWRPGGAFAEARHAHWREPLAGDGGEAEQNRGKKTLAARVGAGHNQRGTLTHLEGQTSRQLPTASRHLEVQAPHLQATALRGGSQRGPRSGGGLQGHHQLQHSEVRSVPLAPGGRETAEAVGHRLVVHDAPLEHEALHHDLRRHPRRREGHVAAGELLRHEALHVQGNVGVVGEEALDEPVQELLPQGPKLEV
mmetsp:Transcript_103472/g.329039  ORF Transcript_103472/g.329039 Transcript_103472/m.329039 type:complete len:352 (-) Transcript_103472:232-1287(-)